MISIKNIIHHLDFGILCWLHLIFKKDHEVLPDRPNAYWALKKLKF